MRQESHTILFISHYSLHAGFVCCKQVERSFKIMLMYYMYQMLFSKCDAKQLIRC